MTANQPERLDRIERLVEKNAEAIAGLSDRMNQAATERAELRADAEADRKMILAILEHMDQTHDENQQILNYLFGQQRGNGHGNQPEP